MTEFKDRLVQALGGQSVNGAAKVCGISQTLMRKYLDGSLPSVDKAVQLAKNLNVSISWLATGEGTPDGQPAPLTEFDIVRNTAQSLPDRIKMIVKKLNGFDELFIKTGIAESELQAFAKGDKVPTNEQLAKIADAAGFGVEWMLSGSGSIERIEGMAMPKARAFKHAAPLVQPAAQAPKDKDICRLPVMTVEASAGAGAAVMVEEVAEYMSLSRSIVRSLGLTAGEAFVVYARGESMEPLIKGGELLICSYAERHIKAGDGIYLLRLEGDILVKHLQRLPGGKMRVFSENARYAPFEVALNDGVDFRILGKVLHVMRQV